MIKHIFFDYDGTLLNTGDIITYCFMKSIEVHLGIKDHHIPDELIGQTFNKIINLEFPEVDNETVSQMYNTYMNIYIEQGKNFQSVYKNVEVVLEQLQNKYNLYILSLKNQKVLKSSAEIFGLSKYFIDIFGVLDLGENKIDTFRRAIQKYNLDTEQVMIVGDSYTDYNTAKEFNTKFIYAGYGFGKVDCDVKINNFEEILKFI